MRERTVFFKIHLVFAVDQNFRNVFVCQELIDGPQPVEFALDAKPVRRQFIVKTVVLRLQEVFNFVSDFGLQTYSSP